MFRAPLDREFHVHLDMSKSTCITLICNHKIFETFFTVLRSKFGKQRDTVPPGLIKETVREVFEKQASIRTVAKKWNISKSTLHNYIKKQNPNITSLEDIVVAVPNYAVHKVFNAAEEQELFNYLEKSAFLHFGLTKQRTRLLAFEYAKAMAKNAIFMGN